MNTSEINALIRAYNLVAKAIDEAYIPSDVLNALPALQADAVAGAKNHLMFARVNLARVIWEHTDALKIEEIEEPKGMAND